MNASPLSTLVHPHIQLMGRSELRALQRERLRAQVQRVLDTPIPFWQRKLHAAGITGVADLTDERFVTVPTTVKQEFRESEAACPPVGDYRATSIAEAVRVVTTTGTSGRPTIILLSRLDLAAEHEAYERNERRMGVQPGKDILATAHPGYMNGGEAIVRAAAEAMGLCCVSIGPPEDDDTTLRAIELLRLVKPTRFNFFPHARRRIIDVALRNGIDPREFNLDPDITDDPRAQYRRASAGLDAFGYLGTACAFDRGAHLVEDHVLVEILADDGTPVPPGVRGRMVVTTLTRDNLVLRYDTEDVAHVEQDQCACGETSQRLFWHGRRSDVVQVGTRALLPIDVSLVLSEFPALRQPTLLFYLVREKCAPQDSLRVCVEAPADAPIADAQHALVERLGVPAAIERLDVGAIARSAYKASQVVDE